MLNVGHVLGAAAALALLAGAATACGNGAGEQTLQVSAAASLTGVFEEVARDYETTHSGTRVRLNLAGSSTLATQITGGAPADVFASADLENMREVDEAGLLLGRPQVFARNRLGIVVQAGNPKNVRGLADLARGDLVVSMCAPEVPAGAYARQTFSRAGLPVPDGSHELDVKQVVNRVRLGEADAGLAYVTDVAGALARDGTGDENGAAGNGSPENTEGLELVPIPAEHNVTAAYPVAALSEAGEPFVDHLFSEAGRRILRAHRFLPAASRAG